MDVYTSVVMAAIRRIIAFTAVLAGSFGVLFFTVGGCRQGFDWQGNWSGTRNLAVVPGTAPEVANSVRRVTLSISNGEYELHASGVPSKGVFHASGKEASLEPVTRLDRTIENAISVKLKANEDGTITLSSPDNLDSGPIILRRESQPQGSNVRNR